MSNEIPEPVKQGSPSTSISRAGAESITRIVVLGGGFGGLYATRRLQKLARADKSIQVTLVNRTNYFLMTPLLFEAGSGVLEPRHAVSPIRPLLRSARFIQAEVREIDLDRRVVHTLLGEEHDEWMQPGRASEIPFDHLVLALGGIVNASIVPGSEHARTFKTLADAIALRNHVIQAFERADVATDPADKKRLLTFVIIGGGLVGVELMGELTEFVFNVTGIYQHVEKAEVRFELIEAEPRIIAEMEPQLGEYATKVLQKRGVSIQTGTRVARIEPGKVHLPSGEVIEAETVVVSTGVLPSPLVGGLPLDKDHKGRAAVAATMRSKSHPNVWALGDCASIPGPDGKPYPPLAQHALREARVVAENIIAVLAGREPQPFIYKSKGTLAALGRRQGVGRVYKLKIYGFIAWWVWRSYYLFQMPQWSRRLRIIIDWTIALVFKNDVVQLDLDRVRQGVSRPPAR